MTREDAVFLIFAYQAVVESKAATKAVQESIGTYGFEKLDQAITALRLQYNIPDADGNVPKQVHRT